MLERCKSTVDKEDVFDILASKTFDCLLHELVAKLNTYLA